MSKKCKKCIGKVPEGSDREVCDHCFAVACCVNSKELYENMETVAESLNDAIEFTGSMVSKEKRDKWTNARDTAWNLLRRLEK